MTEKLSSEVVVVGAGVIGLAVAAKLSARLSVVLTDTYAKFGQETSSRNSEVVHSGIYYPVNSRKTEFCIAGRNLLYDFCAAMGVPFQKVGKFVVAASESECAYLEKLAKHCESLDVPAQWATQDEIHAEEPLIKVHRGLYLPQTGIVDSHSFMAALERRLLDLGGIPAYQHQLKKIEKAGAEWEASFETPSGEVTITTPRLINCTGLAAAEWSNEALSTQKYEHRYCRGRYFALTGKFRGRFRHLIYPVPPKDGLGIHVTIDMNGEARLGPDVDWCPGIKYQEVNRLYDCDWEALRSSFVLAAQRYCPAVTERDLSPGLIGVRAKLFIDGVAHPDFVVENHDGFVHCLGIESPGLTASLKIAAEVDSILA